MIGRDEKCENKPIKGSKIKGFVEGDGQSTIRVGSVRGIDLSRSAMSGDVVAANAEVRKQTH